jgi:tetratricopeptide (TPR) repeat protein
MVDYAASLEALERYEDAARAYTEVIKKRPDDMEMHYSLGRCYFELERWDDAIGAWRTVVAFDRDYGQAYSGLASAYFETGDYDRAWLAVRDCQRLGAYTDPTLISKLQEASGKLGPE